MAVQLIHDPMARTGGQSERVGGWESITSALARAQQTNGRLQRPPCSGRLVIGWLEFWRENSKRNTHTLWFTTGDCFALTRLLNTIRPQGI